VLDFYTGLFVGLLIFGIFAVDAVRRWWRDNAWKRRWRESSNEDD